MTATHTANPPDLTSARVDALLDLPPHRVVAGGVGRERVRADLSGCADEVARAALAEPLIIPRQLAGLFAGGKRLRPLLVFATAYAADPFSAPATRRRAAQGAVAVELLHLASLVHDDVMDGAGLRHGAPTVNARAGNSSAVLAGDYLVGRSMAAANAMGADEGALTAQTLIRLCAGQAGECAALHDVARGEDAYFAAIAGKTGALFEAACRLGAMAARLDTHECAALAEYGLHLGVGYQLLDDLLDVYATCQQLGKPAGHDIAVGVYTFPVLYALRVRPELRTVLCGADRVAVADAALRIVRQTDAGLVTLEAIRRRHERAVAALSRAGISPDAQAMLAELAAAVLRPPSGTVE